MPFKRKYAMPGEPSKKSKCTKRGCGWEGLNEERVEKPLRPGVQELVCPRCGNNDFYRILTNDEAFLPDAPQRG